MPANSIALSVKINLISPAIGVRFLAQSRVIQSGKMLAISEKTVCIPGG
jgi:hypothetical protein